MKSLIQSKKQPQLVLSLNANTALVLSLSAGSGSKEETAPKRLTFTENWRTGNIETLAQELRGSLDALEIRASQVVLGIPMDWAFFTKIEAPDLSSEDMRLYVETQVEREFPLPAQDLYISYNTFKSIAGEKKACVAGAPKKLVDRLSAILKQAKLKPKRITFSGLAAHLSGALTGTGTGAALSLWPNGSRLEILPHSGNNLIDPRSLDSLWKEENSDTLDSVTLLRELRISLGALREEMEQPIREAHFFDGSIHWTESSRSLLNQGLASLGLQSVWKEVQPDLATIASSDDFEFLPPEPDKWSQYSGKLKYLKSSKGLSIGAGILALLILVFIWQGYRLGSLEKQWAAMEDEVSELEILQDRIRDFRPWFSSNPEHLEALLEITKAFPETGSVVVQQLSIKNQREGLCSGITRDQETLYATIERLEQSPGIRDVQLSQLRGRDQLTFSLKFEWLGLKGQ